MLVIIKRISRMYNFQSGNYGNLLKKNAYNRCIGKDIPEDEMDY